MNIRNDKISDLKERAITDVTLVSWIKLYPYLSFEKSNNLSSINIKWRSQNSGPAFTISKTTLIIREYPDTNSIHLLYHCMCHL